MFQAALKELVDNTDGGIAGLVMDSSGIALDSYAKDGAAFDINTVGIEFSVVVGGIRRASTMLEAGTAHEIAIGSDKLITVIRTLGEQYFLALTMLPEGNIGRGRYNLRLMAPKILAELVS
jgi:predicted regulator of Ras-like GTPase activity (Roadblock/LC7/MglB family)